MRVNPKICENCPYKKGKVILFPNPLKYGDEKYGKQITYFDIMSFYGVRGVYAKESCSMLLDAKFLEEQKIDYDFFEWKIKRMRIIDLIRLTHNYLYLKENRCKLYTEQFITDLNERQEKNEQSVS